MRTDQLTEGVSDAGVGAGVGTDVDGALWLLVEAIACCRAADIISGVIPLPLGPLDELRLTAAETDQVFGNKFIQSCGIGQISQVPVVLASAAATWEDVITFTGCSPSSLVSEVRFCESLVDCEMNSLKL